MMQRVRGAALALAIAVMSVPAMAFEFGVKYGVTDETIREGAVVYEKVHFNQSGMDANYAYWKHYIPSEAQFREMPVNTAFAIANNMLPFVADLFSKYPDLDKIVVSADIKLSSANEPENTITLYDYSITRAQSSTVDWTHFDYNNNYKASDTQLPGFVPDPVAMKMIGQESAKFTKAQEPVQSPVSATSAASEVGSSGSNSNGIFIFYALCGGVILLSLYILPFSIARRRNVDAKWNLLLVNLLIGWTLIGWLACLLWAALGQTKAQRAFYESQAQALKATKEA